MDILDRFNTKYTIDDSTGCWNWTGYISKTGYGLVWNDGRSTRAHRVAYELFVGELQDEMVVDHLCRNRSCVNPEHLEQVTNAENIRRGENNNRKKTHCKRGHELKEESIYRKRKEEGYRECLICKKERSALYYKNNKDKLTKQMREYQRRIRNDG